MMKSIALSAAALTSAEVFYQETFDNTWEDRWASSGDGKAVLSAGKFYGDAEDDKGLQTSQDAKFYHYSSKIGKEFSNKDKDFVVSFSVKHEQKIDCGGGYLKLLKPGFTQDTFNGDSDYNIMFGPDICGSSKKVHVIMNYKGKNVELSKTIAPKTDEFTHTYTLIVSKDNTYEVQIDGESKQKGSLEEDFDFLPEKLINDPEQSKPDDWVEEAMIDDPEDVKPDGYDDIEAQIIDADAAMPEDWDEEDDGEWEAPMVDNPEYKGPFNAKRISNPDYKGAWVHPQVVNPEYAPDSEIYSFDSFAGVGFDVWQVKSGTIIDNIILADSLAEVEAFNTEHDHTAAAAAKAKSAAAEKVEADEAERAAVEEDEDEDDEEDEKEEL